jgi:DNA-binding SARP family transcriptional activator
MGERIGVDEAVHPGAQRPEDLDEAWQRLLVLEREVRELRQLLSTDAPRRGLRALRSAHEPSTADQSTLGAQAGFGPRSASDSRQAPYPRQASDSPSASRQTYRPPDWQVTCLGGFQIRSAGRVPPPCSSRRGWGILQYLLSRPGYLATRDALIEAFWPDAEPGSGAHSLQMAIHALRRALRGCGPGGNDETIVYRDGQYGLNPALTVELDVQRFRAACERGRRAAAAGQTEAACWAFEEALALYAGPFLPESCHDEWAEPQRVGLHDLRLDVLGWLSGTYAARAEWEQSAALCREILDADPYREDAIRQLLSSLAASGRLAEVERTYRACRERIWQDLQVEPAPETVRLYQQLTRPSPRASAVGGRSGI